MIHLNWAFYLWVGEINVSLNNNMLVRVASLVFVVVVVGVRGESRVSYHIAQKAAESRIIRSRMV